MFTSLTKWSEFQTRLSYDAFYFNIEGLLYKQLS